jgi:CSLREA domain-containing protein
MVSTVLDRGPTKSRYAFAAVLWSAVAKGARTYSRRLMITAALALALGLSSVAGATTYTVNTLEDSGGVVNTCSLRDAINAANGTPTSGSTCKTKGGGNDAINFSVIGTIMLASTLPEVTDSQLTITGPAAPGITIDGGGIPFELEVGSPGVQVIQVASRGTLNLKQLTIANGANFGDPGGGIRNDGTLTVSNSTFADNDSVIFTTGGGGAIYNDGHLTVTNSTFSGNQCSPLGGAIFNDGSLNVINTTFSGNIGAEFGFGRAGAGGAIYNDGTTEITNSTFSGNFGLALGGAISTDGTLTVVNSTFFGNRTSTGPFPGPGAGIQNSGTLTVTNSTFSGNGGGAGGGIANAGFLGISNGGVATLKSTILANSSGGFETPPSNCSGGTIIDAGYNISDDGSCGFARTGSAHNGDSVDPLLSATGVADNGGPTQTVALQEGSPAIDAIPLADCTDEAVPPQRITNDQRGFLRPDDQEAFCDIGAYESNALRVENLNTFVTFCPSASCGSGAGPFRAEAAGCPTGQATYGFNAVLTNGIAQILTDLQINVEILTNGNQWKLPSGQLLAGGGAVALAATGAHDSPTGDGNTDTLQPGQSATVPFTICLANRNRFQFLVDVYGNRVSSP